MGRDSAKTLALQGSPDWTGALLLVGLTTALTSLLGGLAARFYPGWSPGWLVAACLLVAVETTLVRHRMLRGRHHTTGASGYLAAELFSLVVLMRVATTLGQGEPAVGELAAAWVRAPLTALDGPFLAHVVAGLACALAVRAGLGALAQLERPAAPPVTAHALDAEIAQALAAARDRATTAGIATALARGGALGLLALSGQAVRWEAQGLMPQPVPIAASLAGMIYLVCAILLYSRARLGLLHALWQRDGREVAPEVRRTWFRLSTLLVLSLAGLGTCLPLSYGGGMLDPLRGGTLVLLNLIGLALLALGLLGFGLLGLLLLIPALLLALLGTAGPGLPPQVAGALGDLPTTTARTAPLTPGLIFWLCMLLLAGYALWLVVRRQQWAQVALARLRAGWLYGMSGWLQRCWRHTRATLQHLGTAMAIRRSLRTGGAGSLRIGRGSLRGQDVASRVRLLYHTILRRAAWAGLPRHPAVTPSEYEAALATELPESSSDISALTAAYLKAAYDQRPPEPTEVAAIRDPSRRLQRALRRRGPGREPR